MLRLSPLIAAFLIFAVVSFGSGDEESRFATLKLGRGIEVDLPKSWMLLNGKWNALIETVTQSKMDLAKMDNVLANQVNLVSARSMPAETYASFRIDLSRTKTYPESVRQMTKKQIEEFDENVKRLMPKMIEPERILIWQGTSIESYSGYPATVTHFLRSGPRGPVLVWIRDIAIGDGALSLNTSYRASEEALWKPVIERAVRSLKIPQP